MALAINPKSKHFTEICEILHQFADHAKICPDLKCSVAKGTYCDIGGMILHELTKFGEDVREVPENWKGDPIK